jgi:hypothetical protein
MAQNRNRNVSSGRANSSTENASINDSSDHIVPARWNTKQVGELIRVYGETIARSTTE